MKQSNTCPKCGSTDIIADAEIFNSQDLGTILISTFRRPNALVFRGRVKTALSAWVCSNCGFAELYAGDPKKLKDGTD